MFPHRTESRHPCGKGGGKKKTSKREMPKKYGSQRIRNPLNTFEKKVYCARPKEEKKGGLTKGGGRGEYPSAHKLGERGLSSLEFHEKKESLFSGEKGRGLRWGGKVTRTGDRGQVLRQKLRRTKE